MKHLMCCERLTALSGDLFAEGEGTVSSVLFPRKCPGGAQLGKGGPGGSGCWQDPGAPPATGLWPLTCLVGLLLWGPGPGPQGRSHGSALRAHSRLYMCGCESTSSVDVRVCGYTRV